MHNLKELCNKMTNYVSLLLTANGCGHCTAFRGDGLVNNGKNYMSSDFLKSIFDIAPNKINLINIHYGSMSGLNEHIVNISKFKKNKQGEIEQEHYYQDKGMAMVSAFRSERNTRRNLGVNQVVKGKQKIGWVQFVKEKLPQQLKHYNYFYPCLLVMKSDDWKKAITSEKYPLLALTNAGYTIQKGGIYQLDKIPQSIRERNIDFKVLIKGVVDGSIKLAAHQTEEKKPASEPVKKPEIVAHNDFVIKNYEEF